MKTEAEKTSYALGMDVGISFKQLPAEIDLDSLVMGINDSFKGEELKLSREEFQSLMTKFQQQMQAIQQENAKMQEAAGEENLKAGEAFLEENKTKNGVVTTVSGLQYLVLDEGDGDIPMADDVVSVHYKGTLLNGTEFDSSHKRGEPATFPVKGVIPGWTEALQLMKVNSKYKLFIPSGLAYGQNSPGGVIGPNSVLIFEVELLEIKK